MQDGTIRLGHVQLRVRDLDRSRAFYEGLLGLRVRETGRGVVLLGEDPGHHQLALHAVGDGAPNCPALSVGLSHIAFEVDDRRALLRRQRALAAAGVRVVAVDLGVSWSLYVSDPDGNEVEIYCDTRRVPGGRPMWEGRGDALNLGDAWARLEAEEAEVAG